MQGPLPRAFVLALLCTACQDNAKPGNPEPNAIVVTYVCGNEYSLESRDSGARIVEYRVGTSEIGELRLPPGSSTAPSATKLTTLTSGDLAISSGDETSTVPNRRISCPAPPFTSDPRAIQGEWSPPFKWPVVAVHLHLLPDGRVLSWGRIGQPTIWNPATNEFTEVPSGTMLFCAGHTFLSDGRLLVTGGHLDDERGLPDANIFSAITGSWTPVQPMHWGRWYPTSTMLPDGEVITLAGKNQDGVVVETPELWDGNSWQLLSGATRDLPYYPRTFVAPNGLLFYAGELGETAYLDPRNTGSWIPVATSSYGRRDYGSAVMYRPGKVMILGGSNPPDAVPTNTAEVIDLDEVVPAWRYTDPMTYARRHLNATLLPDGTVLATGGTSSPGFSNPVGSIHAAELWNPATGHWRTLASNGVNRVYHSTTLLLSDGRVLHSGSGDGPGLPRELNAELFSPPYLFRGRRPEIANLPDRVGYGQEFVMLTNDAPQVVRVTLVRLGSVTHAFDQSQRFAELEFSRVAGGLRVRAPSSGALAPPGPYLLFLLDGAGIPSLGKVVGVG